jgi:iron complex outermembrane recepter protein
MLLACALGMLIATWSAPFAQAAAPGREPAEAVLDEDIPTQSLDDALVALTEQTGLHFVYVSDVVRQQKSRAVHAGLDAVQALTRLLDGTGLQFEFLTADTVRILAMAATAGPSASESVASGLPAVIVTGSRIPLPPQVAAASPVQIVTAQEISLQGSTDAVDIMSMLPQMITSSGADSGNHSNPESAAGGFTTADLRGLRPQRTLVLVNGRRLGPGDPNTANPAPAPDLDQIPVAMIERVEVLTGGATATYGPDAIAGVVNFILKDDVQGVQIDSQYGFAQHVQHDGQVEQLERNAGFAAATGSAVDGMKRGVSVLAGTAFGAGAGQLTAYITYQDQDPVRGAARDYTGCPLYSASWSSGIATDNQLICSGSAQSNLFSAAPGDGNAYSVAGSRFVPWPAANVAPPAYFNVAPYFSSQRADQRWLTGLLGHFEFDPAARLYVELGLMDDRTQEEISPSGLFFASNPLTLDGSYAVNCSNPLLSAQQAAILCAPAQIAADRLQPGSVNAAVEIGRRNVEGSPRESDFEHRNYRAVGGVDGRLGEMWRYDFYVLWHYTSLFQTYDNYLSNTAIGRALQVTSGAGGHPVCISGGACVPYDIFTSGAVTSQQVAFLAATASDEGTNTEQIIEGNVTGQLASFGFASPWAHDGFALNSGFQHRRESLRFAPDRAEFSDDLSGLAFSEVAIDRRVSVDEGYIELRAPVFQDRPFMKELDFSAGYRYTAYSTSGTTDTWKFDVQVSPLSDARLRASFDRAVRAPSLTELYTPLALEVADIANDACAPTDGGATHAAASAAQCLHTGVSAAQYGNGIGRAYGGTNTVPQCGLNCGLLVGGNPTLSPETADTWSIGMLLTPVSLTTFNASVDYFRIRLRGEIGTVPESVTLQQCLTTGDPVLCSQVVRSSAGALIGNGVADGGYIRGDLVNTGASLVSGIDLQSAFRQPLPGNWGSLNLSLNGTWQQHNASTPYRSAPSYDCAGLFGNTCLNGSVIPRWRHNLRVTWELPARAHLSAQWRFIGHTGFDNNSAQALLQNQEEGRYDPAVTHIPNYSYLDLAATWEATRHLQVRLGVNNVLDRDPPVLPEEVSAQAGQINTFPVYDVLGRNFFLGLRATL